MKAEFDGIVIGAGVGGLVAAALLSARGRRVLVVEREDRVGGFQHGFERDGFIFEANFHFLQDAGPGRPVREILKSLGIEPKLTRLDPIALFRYPDRDVIMGNDRDGFISLLTSGFPGEVEGIGQLFETSQAIYRALARMEPSPLLMQYAMDTVDSFTARFIRDERLKSIIGAWSAYFGYGSADIAALAIIVFMESCWDGGVYHPVGGIGSILNALRAHIEAGGGEIRCSTAVRHIRVEDGAVRGVVSAEGEKIDSPVVISSADAGSTFIDLLGDVAAVASERSAIAGLKRFRSPFCVYLGVRTHGLDLRDGAAVRVVFNGYDLAAQDAAQLRGDFAHAPLCLGIPTRSNPELAPAGHAIVIVYSFLEADTVRRLLSDETAARDTAQGMIKRAECLIPGLGENIVRIETSASATAQLYAARTDGAIGWAPSPQQLPKLPSHHTAVAGLYLAGQWTRTGAGMNNVFVSAAMAASSALEFINNAR